MKQFIETICILDGAPRHLEWHQSRINATLQQFYPAHRHSWTLDACIDVPSEFQSGKVKCRVRYDAHLFSIHYFNYSSPNIISFQLVEMPLTFDYCYKYADRSVIEQLTEQKGQADDIIMTRKGWITDTSMANLAFQKEGRWYSPFIPLLAGTTWKRLIAREKLIPCPVHKTQLDQFESFRVFNAMNDWDETADLPIQNIIF